MEYNILTGNVMLRFRLLSCVCALAICQALQCSTARAVFLHRILLLLNCYYCC